MGRKNFISRLFMIGIAAVIPKAFMKPIRRPFIMGQPGPELYIPQTSGKIIPSEKIWVSKFDKLVDGRQLRNMRSLTTNEIREILLFEAPKDS